MRRLNQTKRVAQLSLVLFSLILNLIPANSQTRRGRAGQRPTAPAASPAKSAQPPRQQQNGKVGERVPLVRSRKAQTMSEAFTSGKLPEPLRMPTGSIDERAAAMAKAVSAGDASSTSALYAALLAAGYGVRDTNGSVLQTIERGQGPAFEAWEVAVMSKLYGEGYGVTLKHLSEAFTRNVPEFKDVPLATVLLEGIRAGAKSDHPAVRFWARFIVELGRNSGQAYDLLGQADAAKVRLDAVQTALILKRLTGDLAVIERRGQQARSNFREGDSIGRQRAALYGVASYFDWDNSQSNLVNFMRVGMKHGGGGLMRTPGAAQSPCNFNELESVILDYNALGTTTAFGQLAERLGVSSIEKYGKAASVANLVLTVLKFIASYALLKTEITIDGQPLVRTKDTSKGEQRTLSAKLEMDSDKWQMLNCFRPALNAAGLDFNLPGAGPIKDVNVEWKLIEGGDSRSTLSTLSNSDAVRILGAAVESYISGKPAGRIENTDIERAGYGEAIVSLEPLPGADLSMTKQRTGEDGVSRIKVIGAPQKKDLSREKLTKVNKVAGVRVDIQLKPMKIKDAKDVVSNFGDIAGNAIAFLTGDSLGGALGTAAEMAYRSNWYRSEPFYFLVNDWEPCEEGWNGTITIVEDTQYQATAQAGSAVTSIVTTRNYEETFEVKGSKAIASGLWEFLHQQEGQAPGASCKMFRRTKTDGTGEREAKFSVIMTEGSDDYRIFVSAPPFDATENYESTQCGGFSKQQTSKTTTVGGISLSGLEGKIDPKNPTELSGSKTMPSTGGSRKITWNLRRCK